MRPLTVLGLGILATIAAAGTWSRLEAEQPDRMKPHHAVHAEAEIECETCHAGVASSTSFRDLVRPDHDTCADCHDVDDEEACGTCHENPDEPAARPGTFSIAERFGHAIHIADDISCESCHGPAAAPVRTEKATCRSCHATASGLSDCALCHGAGERLHPVSHQPGWLSSHALPAQSADATCANCHTDADCEDCHAGDNVRPRSHGLNYAFAHALDARGNELACAACHTEPSFCVDCHVVERVLPDDHASADWVLDLPGGGRHAETARFELETCVSCHDAGSAAPTCAECHGR